MRERWQPGIDVPARTGRADSGDIEIDLVELLLENKADINSRTGQDQTPLGTVAPKWTSGIRQITRFYARVLKLEIDVEAIKTARPRITTLLRLNGGKLGSELQ